VSDLNITAPFAHHARALADKAAIVHGTRVLTYRELDPLVRRVAAHLSFNATPPASR